MTTIRFATAHFVLESGRPTSCTHWSIGKPVQNHTSMNKRAISNGTVRAPGPFNDHNWQIPVSVHNVKSRMSEGGDSPVQDRAYCCEPATTVSHYIKADLGVAMMGCIAAAASFVTMSLRSLRSCVTLNCKLSIEAHKLRMSACARM
jgi:hypothetical protein